MRRALALLALLAGCLPAPEPEPEPGPPPAPPTDTVTLFFTRDMQGFVDLCGCSPDMPGAFARLAALRTENPDSVWLDGGGWAHPPDHEDPVPEVTARLFQEGFGRLGYSAAAVSPEDRGAWLTLAPRRQVIWLAGSDPDFIDGELVLDEHDHEGHDHDADHSHGPAREVAIEVFWVEEGDYVVLAAGEGDDVPLVARVARYADMGRESIVLSSLSAEANRAVLEEAPAIAYLIGDAPEDRGGLASRWSPPLLPYGWEVGEVTLPGGDARRHYMGGGGFEGWDDSASLWIAGIRQQGFEGRRPVATGAAPDSAVCGACHTSEHAVWERSGHAGAWATLESKGEEDRPDCVGCHSVGWDPNTLTYDGENVGCLACHTGDAAMHLADPASAPLGRGDRDACASCHRPDHSLLYSPEGYWPLIAHGPGA